MKKYGKLMAAVAALAVLIGAAHILYAGLTKNYQPSSALKNIEKKTETEETKEDSSEKEHAAPDFAMVDQAGQSKSLHEFFGRPIVLNFWASWCGPCKAEFPDFQKVYEKYGEKVVFLMVNMTDGMRETKEKASAFVEAGGYTFPIYYDALQSAAYTYSVYSLPTTYFIHASGELAAGAEGMLNAESLERGISMILPDAEAEKDLEESKQEAEIRE